MKRALLYVMAAILLGALTMVAPLILLKPSYYELLTSPGVKNTSAFLEALDEGEGTYDEGGALERALSPSNLSSAGLMLVPSFLLALGVSILLKKRIGAAC
ncbi:MAG: hypothetical protein OEW95_12620 [Candidatus Bathyarchaeota archaeon]|nr:hypothetical protein [Candidatus Bathyarchaeota archaeon]